MYVCIGMEGKNLKPPKRTLASPELPDSMDWRVTCGRSQDVTSWQILLTGYAFEGQYDKILELLVQQLRTQNLSSIVVGDGWVSPPKKKGRSVSKMKRHRMDKRAARTRSPKFGASWKKSLALRRPRVPMPQVKHS